MAAAAAADKGKGYFPLAGLANDGWSKEGEATATCFCGTVQLAFVSLLLSLPVCFNTDTCSNPQPTKAPGLVNSFICNCSDCHKLTASMFASNFTVLDTHLKHLRGQENLKTWGQSRTPASGKTMTNFFCNTCGSLMYRVGAAFPGMSILRIGSVDDFTLHETLLKPTVEQFIEYRVGWLPGVEGIKHIEGMVKM